MKNLIIYTYFHTFLSLNLKMKYLDCRKQKYLNNRVNDAGLKIQDNFSIEKTTDKILKLLE